MSKRDETSLGQHRTVTGVTGSSSPAFAADGEGSPHLSLARAERRNGPLVFACQARLILLLPESNFILLVVTAAHTPQIRVQSIGSREATRRANLRG